MPVYFIKTENYVKIGYSSNVSVRLVELQTSNPHSLVVLLVVPGGVELESYLHKKFNDSHYRGEWFYLSSEIENFIKIHKNEFPEYQLDSFIEEDDNTFQDKILDDFSVTNIPWDIKMSNIPRGSNIESVINYVISYYNSFGEEPRNREIVDSTGVSKGQVSTIVSKLKANGFS